MLSAAMTTIMISAGKVPKSTSLAAIPNGTSQHVYGRVAGGVVAPVTNNVALLINLSRTLGHQGGDDFYGTGGLKISF